MRRVRITRRLSVYLDRRDVWIGMYLAPTTVYVCPLPCIVIRYVRRRPL